MVGVDVGREDGHFGDLVENLVLVMLCSLDLLDGFGGIGRGLEWKKTLVVRLNAHAVMVVGQSLKLLLGSLLEHNSILQSLTLSKSSRSITARIMVQST